MPGVAKCRHLDRIRSRRIWNQLGLHHFLERFDRRRAVLLAFGLLGRLERFVVFRFQFFVQTIVGRRLVGRLGDARLGNQLFLQGDNLADDVVRLGQGFGHLVFGHFAGEPFDHQHGVFRAGDNQIQFALFQFVLCGKRHEAAVDQSHPHRCNRPLKRQRRQAQCRRSTIHRQHVGIVLPIAGEDEGLNLHFVDEARGKQRANRPIHQPGSERFLHRRPAFALQKAAGEFARCRGAFAIIAGQRKEVSAAHSGRTAGHGRNHAGLPVGDQATARGLLGEETGFDGKQRRPDLFFYTYFQVFIPV